ncbi:phytoene desaturase family protein [Streptomyces profundus]|uniref:phytoene desaturase family protein n=1 Tax=Streptomyces profundus TaxID=2867410 RepID=UPI001D16CE8E|nr:phytoene desaturase family protein [Streptomyces sp. MA3_2.13]UED82824.1 phytoene desaturase [Streptomyces sp. MA3_2.13]
MRRLSGPTDHVVVVGAGLAGLATALHLLGAGRRVTVVEREALPGGQVGRRVRGGYHLDTGPAVLTLPDLLEEPLAAVGEKLGDRLELTPLHPAYTARFADGGHLAVHTDPEAMEAEVERFAGARDAAGYRRLRAWLERLHAVRMKRFVDSDVDTPLGPPTPDLARLAALGGLRSLDSRVRRLLSDERLRRVFTFRSLCAGVPPDRALSTRAVIAPMDTVAGVWFPRGGVHALPRALADAAADAGARLRYGETVIGLERSGARITAVLTERDRVRCDAVVLTADLPVAYRLLGWTARRPASERYAPSAVVLHLGVDRGCLPLGELGHHTLSFGLAWERTLHQLTAEGRPMTDPSLLITRPTASDPTLAPAGRELLSVLAPCPNTAIGPGPIEWRELGPRYRNGLVAALERRGLTGLGAAVEEECLVTPAHWSARGHRAGTPFPPVRARARTGPFRPRDLVPGTENAVLASCGTTPGAGVPTALLSGKLAAARVTGRAER